MFLPERIKHFLENKAFRMDTIGMSGSNVLLFDDVVLKVQPDSRESTTELTMMRWLKGRVSVPDVICHEMEEGKSYLLMSRVPGKMSCDLSLINDPERLTDILAEGLRMLWSVDISDCPIDASLDQHLAAAEYNVKNGMVDLDNVEPETFGENGFKDPADLISWLKANRPKEDLVFSHGDFCLPNVFADQNGVCGFIDLGRSGVADRYRDIAICYRSLKSNLHGSYGDHPPVEFDLEKLFHKLGIVPDWEKIRYYILMDELF